MVRSLLIKLSFVLTKKVILMTNPTKPLPAQLNIIKIPLNVETDFQVTEETEEWVKEILVEMNENSTEISVEENLESTFLHVTGTYEKKFTPEYNEYLLMTIKVDTEYATECIRTLKPMKVEMELEFKVCFISETLAESEEFKEIDESFFDGEVYELYFYTKKTAAIQEMIHEQIYLNYNQYPILDAESEIFVSEDEEATKQ